MRDLAPEIYRQRLVIEGYPAHPVTDGEVVEYLSRLSDVCGMVRLMEPVTHRSDTYGEAGWVHWETSGAHLYAWEKPRLFLSVDIYTCKAFLIDDAVDFTKTFFDMSVVERSKWAEPLVGASVGGHVTEDLIDLAGEERSERAPVADELSAELWSRERMTSEFAKFAVESLLDEWRRPSQRFGVYFLSGLDVRSSLGRMVELERFADEFANDSQLLRRLYSGFELAGKTELIVVVDHELACPAGVIRTVRNSDEYGCRILNDLQATGENGWDLTMDEIRERSDFAARKADEIIDIPTIAVSKEYSGGRQASSVSQALCAGLYQRSLETDALTWVCSLDRVPYILIQEYGGGVMNEFDGVPAQPYYGSDDTTPLWCNFREYAARLEVERPDIWARFAKCEGLDDYFITATLSSFSLERPRTAVPARE
jgi:S-adenosylmethionine decarboxylase